MGCAHILVVLELERDNSKRRNHLHPTYYALGIVADAQGVELMARFLGMSKCGKVFANGNRMLKYDKKNCLLLLNSTKDEALKLGARFNFEFE